ncbi:MAG: dipicolinate synthase subunit DpsA [Acutalibacter sp.]|jgi:dipicolinate synthase subunit A
MKVWGILGGDRRQLYLARSLREDGRTVALCGLEKLEGAEKFPNLDTEELCRRSQVILLPLPATRDGRFLNAPFSRESIPLDDKLAAEMEERCILGGMVEKLRHSSPRWEGMELLDYFQREELTTGNAFLTAEAALALSIEQWPGALAGSRCLVTGFGRIGKALCPMLRSLGAWVDCAARKPWDLAAIQGLGCRALTYDKLSTRYDLIFNTVPAPVLGEGILCRQSKDTLLLELASAPGGIDRDAAGRCGLQVLDAPSLPGRFSPEASGKLIKEAVYHILDERRMSR